MQRGSPQCECEFESDVLAAVIQSRWPDRAPAELRAHAANCVICSDVAAVAGVIDNHRDSLRFEAVVPDSGRVWWLAQLRARRENAKTAASPITATQLFAGACAVGFLGACIGATSEAFQSALRWTGALFGGINLTGLLAEHSILALAMAAVLFVVPAAAWLALRRD
jgi:hypothetical protein